jgi:hypothetical protein
VLCCRDWPKLVHAAAEQLDEEVHLDLLGGWHQEFDGDA